MVRSIHVGGLILIRLCVCVHLEVNFSRADDDPVQDEADRQDETPDDLCVDNCVSLALKKGLNEPTVCTCNKDTCPLFDLKNFMETPTQKLLREVEETIRNAKNVEKDAAAEVARRKSEGIQPMLAELENRREKTLIFWISGFHMFGQERIGLDYNRGGADDNLYQSVAGKQACWACTKAANAMWSVAYYQKKIRGGSISYTEDFCNVNDKEKREKFLTTCENARNVAAEFYYYHGTHNVNGDVKDYSESSGFLCKGTNDCINPNAGPQILKGLQFHWIQSDDRDGFKKKREAQLRASPFTTAITYLKKLIVPDLKAQKATFPVGLSSYLDSECVLRYGTAPKHWATIIGSDVKAEYVYIADSLFSPETANLCETTDAFPRAKKGTGAPATSLVKYMGEHKYIREYKVIEITKTATGIYIKEEEDEYNYEGAAHEYCIVGLYRVPLTIAR